MARLDRWLPEKTELGLHARSHLKRRIAGMQQRIHGKVSFWLFSHEFFYLQSTVKAFTEISHGVLRNILIIILIIIQRLGIFAAGNPFTIKFTKKVDKINLISYN